MLSKKLLKILSFWEFIITIFIPLQRTVFMFNTASDRILFPESCTKVVSINSHHISGISYSTVCRSLCISGRSSMSTSTKQPRSFSTIRLHTVDSSVIPDVGHRRITVEPLALSTTTSRRPAPMCVVSARSTNRSILAGSAN